MDSILCLMHTEDDGTPGKPALEALAAAQEIAGAMKTRFDVGLVGSDVQAAADAVAHCGAGRYLGVSGSEFGQPRYASDAAAAEAIIKAASATIVIAPQTSRLARVLGGVAHRLGGRVDTHATAMRLDDNDVVTARWYYRQRMEATLRRVSRPWILVMDTGWTKALEGAPGKAKVESVDVSLSENDKRTTVTGVQAPAADAQTIRPDADLLFVAGAGWTKKQADGQTHVPEAEKLIGEFLNRTQASLGGSKSLVDITGEGQAVLSFMTHLNQIGQTGSTPRHPKGLATCCHGEEPHTVGWRFVTERRAVNKDPNCGWARGKADVLYVADAFAVIAKVNALLAKS